MKFNNRQRSGGSVINLTPLIDCMFLLVIFIMLAARFDPEGGIPVDLPKASATQKEARERPKIINVSVDAEGRVYLEKDEIDTADLERKIVEARTALGDPEGEEAILVVYGDTNAHHGKVVEVLDAAARAKQKKVTVRTRQ